MADEITPEEAHAIWRARLDQMVGDDAPGETELMPDWMARVRFDHLTSSDALLRVWMNWSFQVAQAQIAELQAEVRRHCEIHRAQAADTDRMMEVMAAMGRGEADADDFQREFADRMARWQEHRDKGE